MNVHSVSGRLSTGPERQASLCESIEDVHQLGQPFRSLGLALLDALRNALLDVKFEHREADAVHRRFSRRELLEDFQAQARFLHHAPDAPDLPLDTIQTGDDGLLLCGVEHAQLYRCAGCVSSRPAPIFADAGIFRVAAGGRRAALER
jgi:hypothetical protein